MKLSSTISDHKTSISIIIRLSSLITCSTFFVPDEYWQSTEIAHWHVYGYGYLSWEWREQIRPYLHPFVFEIFFRLVKFVGVDYTEVLVYGPHIIQAIISVAADSALYRVAWNMFRNKDAALLALILHWCSWFVFYTSSRTLSNTMEMCFLVLGLSYFPGLSPFPVSKYAGNESQSNAKNCLFFALFYGGIGCIIRPTSLIVWCPLVLTYIFLGKIFLQDIVIATIKVFPILLLLSVGLDCYFHKSFTFVHLNFLNFNIVKNISASYGTHPFHWYLTQGIPVVLSFHVIYLVIGIYHSKDRLLFLAATFYVVVHSLIPHKEFRFLLPVVPIYLSYAGYGMMKMYQLNRSVCKKIFSLIIVSNVLLASYFSTVHQRGTITVMSYLRKLDLQTSKDSVLFLMPCHSTPFYSHLHRNVPMHFLTCDPGVEYVDESAQFYKNHTLWLDTNVGSKSKQYTHIILFNVLAEMINTKMVDLGYTKITSFFHTHFPEGRIGSFVDVYALDNRK